MAVAPQAFNEQVDRGTGFFVIVGKSVVTSVSRSIVGPVIKVQMRPIVDLTAGDIWLSKTKELADEVAELTGGERFCSVVTRLTNYYPVGDEHRFKMEGE